MAKKPFKKRTEEEKKAETAKLLATLEEGVKNFKYDPETFKAILEMQALMPSYSFRNIMLAKAQLPHARFLASFKKWKELNRNVIKGQKAIRILAPRFIKEKDEVTGEEKDQLIGYLGVPVFDYSQTEGEPLPIERVKLKLEGESEEAEHIFEVVKIMAASDHCPITIKHANGANGCYLPKEHEIVIDPKLSGNHRAKTAVHELVHSRLHRNVNKFSLEEMECVAEGTAYVLCSYFGLDTSSYSFGYVKSWSCDEGESLMKYGETIQKAASQLIDEFEEVSAAMKEKALKPSESEVEGIDTTMAITA